MKKYKFLFEDGSQASLTIEVREGRHKNMDKEVEDVKAAVKAVIRGRTIVDYEVMAA